MKAEFLITGANGFIGQHLQQALRSAEIDFVALAGRQQRDLTQPEALANLPPARVLVHLAGAGNPVDFDQDPATSWRINLSGTLNLLNRCRQLQVEHLILASTYVYGPPETLPVVETHPVRPLHAYPRSKYLCEQLVEQFVLDAAAQGHAFRGTALRLFNVYGPGQSSHMLIPTIVKQLQQPVMSLRDPAPRRDFVHVDDVVQAILATAKLPRQSSFEAINIGSGQSYSVAELVALLSTLAGVHPQVKYLQQVRTGEVNEVRADCSKADQLLGWAPQKDFRTGLQDLLTDAGLI